jgi:hypothetical protein
MKFKTGQRVRWFEYYRDEPGLVRDTGRGLIVDCTVYNRWFGSATCNLYYVLKDEVNQIGNFSEGALELEDNYK